MMFFTRRREARLQKKAQVEWERRNKGEIWEYLKCSRCGVVRGKHINNTDACKRFAKP